MKGESCKEQRVVVMIQSKMCARLTSSNAIDIEILKEVDNNTKMSKIRI